MDTQNEKKIKKIITHDGKFHTDEVFACAVLSLLHNGQIEIVRSREPEVWESGDYVVDVGGVYDESLGKFDHHQKVEDVRTNGIPYSSFGLIWKHFGEKVAGSLYVARVIDKRLVQPVDAGDNAVDTFSLRGEVVPYLLHDVINTFRPGWNESRTDDEGFFEALSFAARMLQREIQRTQTEEEGKRAAEEAYLRAEDKKIIVLDDRYPWYEALCSHPEPLFVIKPGAGLDGRWKVEAVRSDVHTFRNRKDLPSTWAGKIGEELAEISGVADALFCHSKLFIATAGSKEGAIQLAKIAVEAN